MRTERRFTCNLLAIASAVMATLFLVACQQSQAPTPASAPPESKPATTDVYVIFEGPWAIVADPKDAHSVLALAPKTKSHRPLGVVPANAILEAGVYELAVPARGADAPTVDKGILQADVDPQIVQRVLDNRSERYAVRLPAPDAYLAETRSPSRVSATYPPDTSTEQDYATAVSLRYSVTSKTGFSLAGTPDAGPEFKPKLLPLDTPVVRFTIDPAEITAHDECKTHARRAFHDLTRLLGLTLYIDFPGSSGDCRKNDPQLAHSEKALLHGLPVEWSVGLPSNESTPTTAGVTGGIFATYLDSAVRRVANGVGAAIYFFHTDTGGCITPIIIGHHHGKD